MVCGTTSDAGKSQFVTGLCRLLARNGVRVAPFKAQNMANNSYVTAKGCEIGRAQALQAIAAGVEPEGIMNPILLKPSGERVSQVMVNGASIGHLTAAEYQEHKPELLVTVLESLNELRSRFDVVICEGAGSPTFPGSMICASMLKTRWSWSWAPWLGTDPLKLASLDYRKLEQRMCSTLP